MHARDARLLLSRNIFKKINAWSTRDMVRISVFITFNCSQDDRDLFFTASNLELLNIEP